MIEAPILVRPDFERPFILDVNWSIRGVGLVLSQKQNKHECVIAYARKGFTLSQRKFHPMEGECYALNTGDNAFPAIFMSGFLVVRTNLKPLEWLAIVFDPFGRKSRWISMLQDFSFKIVHRAGTRLVNANALSCNPISSHDEDEDFGVEIQDEKKNVDVA